MRQHYGTVKWLGGATKSAWVLKLSPHVALRAKRVFARVAREVQKEICLTDTLEVCRDLAWFLERFPATMSAEDRKRLESRAGEHEAREERVLKILDGKAKPRRYQLALPPRPYQQVGADIAIATGGLLLADELGLGKEQPIDTGVLTPTGYRRIGDLVVGDLVIGSAGKPVRVTGVYPQGVKASFRLRWSDGSSVEAGAEHLWTVNYRRGGKEFQPITVTTEQLRNGAKLRQEWPRHQATMLDLGRTEVYLPMLSGPVEFKASDEPLTVPPYLLGALIANGSLAHGSPCLVVGTRDWEHVRGQLEAESAHIGAVKVRGNATSVGIRGQCCLIRELGLDVLSGEKFIPRRYQRASVADRIALLHGLMDGDGSISAERSRVNYHTMSLTLARDLVELVEGLGGIASIRNYDRTADDKGVEYQVRVRLPESIRPCRLPRKLDRYKPLKRKNPTRSLMAVEYVRDVESVCISVDAPDRLYATEHAILTHNTVSGICMLVDPATRPALVVTQTHLVKQWEREIARFAPPLKVHVIKRGEAYDIAPEVDVLICTYMKLFGWSTALQGRIKSVIYDEVQELRRGTEAKKGQAAFDLSDAVDYRLGLTGTPIYNYGGEAWAIIRAIQPNALGEYEEFVTEWCTGIDSKGRAKLKAPRTFGNYLRSSGLMLRRTRKDVGREIPPVTRLSHAIDCDQKPLKEIESAAGALAEIILGDTKRTDADDKTAEMRLDNMVRQATGVGKAPHVADFVETLLEQGEKVVLFAWHRSVYAILEERLAAYKPSRYSGTESPNQKDEARRRFIEGETPLFIMSLRSGAGLDGLQFVCRTVVFAELDWSPGVHEQCEGRVARDGQTDPVVVYYLVSEDGSDPLMEDVLGVKRAQVEGLRNPERDVMEKQISGDHIQRLARTYVTKRRTA